MTGRILQIESPCKLSVRDEQLVVGYDTGEERTVPLEDLYFLLIDSREVVLTVPVMDAVTRYGAMMAVCDASHTPSTIVAPLHANVRQTQRHLLQAALAETEKDAIWDSIVTRKILSQADVLDCLSLNGGGDIRRMAEGEGVSEREGVVADRYWKSLFGKDFRRDRFGDGPNPLLNYGYSVLRAATVKALLCTGLNPCFGLHHKNQYDDFVLADDVMEPYRAFVDMEVYALWREGKTKVDREAKDRLVAVLLSEVKVGGVRMQLRQALSRTASSLVSRLKNEEQLLLPYLC